MTFPPDTRDFAIITVLFCLGLRVSELCGLNLEDTDLERGSTWIKSKARRERELVPLPAPVVTAVRHYLVHRGLTAGPLVSIAVGTAARPATGDSTSGATGSPYVHHDGDRAGQQAGVGLDQIRTFSRHRSLATMLIYRDEHDRDRTYRTLADVVAGALSEPHDTM